MQWRYCSLALNHRYALLCYVLVFLIINISKFAWRTYPYSSWLLHSHLCNSVKYGLGIAISLYKYGHLGYRWVHSSSLFLRWRHNGHDSVSNHQPHDCLRNRLFRRRSKKTSKLRVSGHCAGNSPGTDEFPAKMASYAENVSIWWRHHD